MALGLSLTNSPNVEKKQLQQVADASDPLALIEEILSQYAQGTKSARDVQNVVRSLGYSLNLRKRKFNPVEVYDLQGKPHDVGF